MPCTLLEIEQTVAPRVGPYFKYGATGGTADTLVCDDLKSTVEVGGITNLWVFRRGRTTAGVPIVGFTNDDRQRRIQSLDRSSGTITVDRTYTNAPVAGEEFELHHLDPLQELRPACQAGLKRCYFEYVAAVTFDGSVAQNLTTDLDWLTMMGQVLHVGSTYATTIAPDDMPFADVYETNGTVWVRGLNGLGLSTVYVTANRPAWTYVNGADSTTGPLVSDDEVPVDLEYAAAAGHIEAWRRARPRLMAAAQIGHQITQEEAALEYTKQAELRVRVPKRRFATADNRVPSWVILP